MDDTISRQAAIDALKEHRALFCDNTPGTFSKLSYGEKCRVDELDTAISTLVNLPSAQPTQTDTSNTLKALDCVERQAAIDALDGEIEITGRTNAEAVKGYVRLVKDRLERLPSVQPEPSTEIQEILNYLDTTLHPIVSPDNWYAYAELYDMVSSFPTAQHWVPCSERLPEEDEQVFVYLFDDSPYIAWICGGRWHTEEFTLDKDEEPVAWMPVPEPHREEGEDD